MRTSATAIVYPGIFRMRGVVWILFFLFSASASLGAELESGKPVAAFRITTLAGVQISPSSQRGRVLVVNLWATWCAPCRQEMPAIEAFYRKYRQRGVDVVAISVDDRSEIAEIGKLMAAYSFPAALAVDSDMKAFGRVRHVPATFVIDRDGVLRRNGWADAGLVDLATLENFVEPLLHPASPR